MSRVSNQTSISQALLRALSGNRSGQTPRSNQTGGRAPTITDRLDILNGFLSGRGLDSFSGKSIDDLRDWLKAGNNTKPVDQKTLDQVNQLTRHLTPEELRGLALAGKGTNADKVNFLKQRIATLQAKGIGSDKDAQKLQDMQGLMKLLQNPDTPDISAPLIKTTAAKGWADIFKQIMAEFRNRMQQEDPGAKAAREEADKAADKARQAIADAQGGSESGT